MKQQVLFKLDEASRTHPFGQETVFEPQRGIIKIELEQGWNQVKIKGKNINQILDSLAMKQIAFHSLKLLSDGISFIVSENTKEDWRSHEIITKLSLMSVHATNLREEHGLVAHILKTAIEMDIEIYHISDVYNCLTLVLNEKEAKRLCQQILKEKYED